MRYIGVALCCVTLFVSERILSAVPTSTKMADAVM